MELVDIKTIYFVGIGGIGMSALARYFHQRGVRVLGYDRTETALTKTLVEEGMAIHYTAQPTEISNAIDLAVYTPAVPADFTELVELRRLQIPLFKRSEVLGIISRSLQTAAVAGTHGKTTTTTLLTHLLHTADHPVNAFLGGIARNFSSNYVAGTTDWVVVEADEYDRSFLHLQPDIAVVLSLDADHLDIYENYDNMLETGFGAFVQQINPAGTLLVRYDLADQLRSPAPMITFGIDGGDFNAHHVRVEAGHFVFDLTTPTTTLAGLRLPLPGRHNVLNATAALATALLIGADPEKLSAGLPQFRGIARRFDFVLRGPQGILIDDYAHHPTELEAAIGAARELYPDKRIIGAFQPHLFSRTRDFLDAFAKALDQLDEVIVLEIYPARETPIPGVTSEALLARMKNPQRRLLSKEACIEAMATNEADVKLILGAGDIDRLVHPIKERMLRQKKKDHG